MNRVRHTIFLVLLALLVVAPAGQVAAQDGPSLVILVRHAEKADVAGNDPPLSEAGLARAKALAASLAHTPISAIVTSTLRRTTETAAIVASNSKLTPEAIGLGAGGTAAHVAAVAAAVRSKKGIVLVVGHSNTTPAILAALGGPRLPDICDSVYSTMYLLLPAAASPSVTIAQFGAPDASGPASCPGMQVR